MEKIYNITDMDFDKIVPIIKKNNLSKYKLDKKDFIVYKDENNIIGFGRIYNIEKNDYELSSLWVNNDFRGQKIGISIIKDLIDKKFDRKNNLFPGCRKELQEYYESVGFEILSENFPDKFHETIKFANSIGVIPIIMKLK